MKNYYLKNGDMYLQNIFTNACEIKTDFIETLWLTTRYDRCCYYTKEVAEELKKKLYILLGIKFELKEVDIDED